MLSVFSFCQFFASPIIGKLSDRYGRKPTLLLSQFSTFLGFLILGIANTIVLLLLARIVDGLLGSNFTVTQAYISDVTEPEERTKIYGYSSAVFGIDADIVTIEVNVSQGVRFFLVGLPDIAVKESQQRIESSLRAVGMR